MARWAPICKSAFRAAAPARPVISACWLPRSSRRAWVTSRERPSMSTVLRPWRSECGLWIKGVIVNIFERLDLTPGWSEEERILLDSVRALACRNLALRAAGYDRNAEFPWANIEDINE